LTGRHAEGWTLSRPCGTYPSSRGPKVAVPLVLSRGTRFGRTALSRTGATVLYTDRPGDRTDDTLSRARGVFSVLRSYYREWREHCLYLYYKLDRSAVVRTRSWYDRIACSPEISFPTNAKLCRIVTRVDARIFRRRVSY
jgi:hypothetical protein